MERKREMEKKKEREGRGKGNWMRHERKRLFSHSETEWLRSMSALVKEKEEKGAARLICVFTSFIFVCSATG